MQRARGGYALAQEVKQPAAAAERKFSLIRDVFTFMEKGLANVCVCELVL